MPTSTPAFYPLSLHDALPILHMYSGFAILTAVIFRLLWGIFGSSTARFSSFIRGPRAVIAYVRGSAAWRKIGHSPIGALRSEEHTSELQSQSNLVCRLLLVEK